MWGLGLPKKPKPVYPAAHVKDVHEDPVQSMAKTAHTKKTREEKRRHQDHYLSGPCGRREKETSCGLLTSAELVARRHCQRLGT